MSGKKLTNDEFILRSKDKFGDRFDYSKTNYKGREYEVTIGCPIHGYVLIKAGYHLDANYGCPECQKVEKVCGVVYADEIWKDIILPGIKDIYMISNYGRCKNKEHTTIDKNGVSYKISEKLKIASNKVNNDELYVHLKKDDDSDNLRAVPIQYLVATTFIPNPNCYDAISFKDGDKTNCKVENLEWDTCTNPKYIMESLPDEIWKILEGYDGYKVSNLGRVKRMAHEIKKQGAFMSRIIPEAIINPSIGSNGYYSSAIYKNGQIQTVRFHRLVAETFIPNPNNLPIVDHIDRNRLNNKVDNLRWVTAMENTYNGGAESVLAIYKDGTTKLFNSLKEASIETGLHTTSIRRRCDSGTGKKSKDGIRFQWANEHTKKSKLASKNRNKGNRFELEVVNKLKEIGYTGCVTARSESKRTDNNKIDVIDLNNELRTNIQTKYLMNCPNYFNIREECNDTSKPFTIIWKKSTNTGENSPGTIAMIDVEYFYHLLKLEKFVKDQNIDINL